jgi:hypothetical protein
VNVEQYALYGKGRSGFDSDFSKGETWDPYWCQGRRARNESQFVVPSSAPSHSWTQEFKAPDPRPWWQKRQSGPNLTEKEIEGIALLGGAILRLAVAFWILASYDLHLQA